MFRIQFFRNLAAKGRFLAIGNAYQNEFFHCGKIEISKFHNMKNLLTSLAVLFFASSSLAQDSETLIAYFTWSGNSKEIARQIGLQHKGDVFEIVPEKSYPTDASQCIQQAKDEHKKQARPKLKTSVEDISKYKTIILIYPNWIKTIPMPVASFLEQHDFANKTLIAICTHGGDKFGNSISDIKKLAPKAKVVEGFHNLRLEGDNLNMKITNMLKNNGL
jgi:flavodoxin